MAASAAFDDQWSVADQGRGLTQLLDEDVNLALEEEDLNLDPGPPSTALVLSGAQGAGEENVDAAEQDGGSSSRPKQRVRHGAGWRLQSSINNNDTVATEGAKRRAPARRSTAPRPTRRAWGR